MGGQTRADDPVKNVPIPAPDGGRVDGIDVSHHNGVINWADKFAKGDKFMFAKATEGHGYIDSQFNRNWANAKAAGLLTGAYCFFHPNQDPIEQADFFLKVTGSLSGRLPPVL